MGFGQLKSRIPGGGDIENITTSAILQISNEYRKIFQGSKSADMLEKSKLTTSNNNSFPNLNIPIIGPKGFAKFFNAGIAGIMG